MWILVSEKTGVKHNLISKKEFTIGRKGVDILIADDPSISRQHAVLQIRWNNIEEQPCLWLKDGSKYGSFVNGMQAKVEEVLKADDVVTFGQFGSNFRVLNEPFIVNASCLSMDAKSELQKTLFDLGDYLVSDWAPNCTHLVMNELKITIKAVCAMVSLKPIVLPSFFTDFLKYCNTPDKSVVAKDYIPPIGEEALRGEKAMFDVIPDRARLFKNKTFIFFSRKQFKKLNVPVTIGGGQVELFDEDDPVGEEKLFDANTCIVQCDCDSPKYSKIIKQLKKYRRRTVPESDIGLAIVYCSLEKFCNPNSLPDIRYPNLMISQTLTEEILEPATQLVPNLTLDDFVSTQTSVAETVFFTQKQDVDFSNEDDSTLEADENTRKRFRSNDSARAPPQKQPRVERESRSTVIKPVINAKEERIDWDDDEDTLPLPAIAQDDNVTATCEDLVQKEKDNSNNRKKSASSFGFQAVKRSNSTTQDNGDCNVSKNSDPPVGFKPMKKSTSMMQDNDERNVSNNSDPPLGFRPAKKCTSTMQQSVVAPDVQKGAEVDLAVKPMKVTLVPLLRKRIPCRREPEAPTSVNAVKNFKNFHKVHSNSATSLPQIIGGKDLQVFNQRVGAQEVNFWLDNEDGNGDIENNFFSNRQPNKRSKRK